MAKKKEPIDLVREVFDRYPGTKLVEYLKEGACLQATVEEEDFSLEKKDGSLLIIEGRLDSPDISVVLNRAACEYLAASKEPDDFVTRTRECINRKQGKCEMDYEVNAGLPRMLVKGYFDFARKLGII